MLKLICLQVSTQPRERESSASFLSEYSTTPHDEDEDVRDPFEGRVDGLYIILISLHGLVRGERMELGKDPDTGGQARMQPLGLIFPSHQDLGLKEGTLFHARTWHMCTAKYLIHSHSMAADLLKWW